MNLLHRKALRDLVQGWASFTACALVLVLGVAFHGAMTSSYLNLQASYRETYRRLRFLDFYLEVAHAPEAVARRLERLPGVAAVTARRSLEVEILQEERGAVREAARAKEGRAAFRASTDAPAETIIGRVLGLPARSRPSVNDVRVEQGRYLAARREVLLEKTFAGYHGYAPGDWLRLRVNGHTFRFRVVGVVTSPEYIWVVRNREYVMPSPRTFGVLFVGSEDARMLAGEGGVNEVHVRMADPSRRAAAMEAAHRMLRPYGAQDPVPREEQASNRLLQEDLQSFERIAYYFPLLFLVIGTVTLYTLLSRVILCQRPQIGILMALGFSASQIARHFLAFAWLVGAAGALGGSLLGHWLGVESTRLYASILGLPHLQILLWWDRIALGGLCGLAAAHLAGWLAVRRVLRMDPAEALYAELSVEGRRPWMERLLPRMGYAVKLPFRNLFRHPRRSLATALGVAFAVCQILVTMVFFDSQNAAIDFYFERIFLHDMRAMFLRPVSAAVLGEVRLMPGVRRAEGVLEVPVRLTYGGRVHTTLLFGLPEAARAVRLYFDERTPARLLAPGPGRDAWLLAGPAARRSLQVEEGNAVRARVPRRVFRPTPGRLFPLAPGLHQPIGSVVYVPLHEARRVLAQAQEIPPDAITAILLSVDPELRDSVRRRLYDLAGVAAVEVVAETRQEVEELLKLFDAYKDLMLAFSAALAFVVVFNAVTISTLERVRELATMRTLGLSGRTVAAMMAVEVLFLWALGAAAGVPLGVGLGGWFLGLYSSDFMHMGLTLLPRSVAATVLGSLVIALGALVPSVRFALGMDLARMARERVS